MASFIDIIKSGDHSAGLLYKCSRIDTLTILENTRKLFNKLIRFRRKTMSAYCIVCDLQVGKL